MPDKWRFFRFSVGKQAREITSAEYTPQQLSSDHYGWAEVLSLDNLWIANDPEAPLEYCVLIKDVHLA